jgi:hypothetical protein
VVEVLPDSLRTIKRKRVLRIVEQLPGFRVDESNLAPEMAVVRVLAQIEEKVEGHARSLRLSGPRQEVIQQAHNL